MHESKCVMEGWIANQEQPDFEVSIIGDSGGPGRQQQKVGRVERSDRDVPGECAGTPRGVRFPPLAKEVATDDKERSTWPDF